MRLAEGRSAAVRPVTTPTNVAFDDTSRLYDTPAHLVFSSWRVYATVFRQVPTLLHQRRRHWHGAWWGRRRRPSNFRVSQLGAVFGNRSRDTQQLSVHTCLQRQSRTDVTLYMFCSRITVCVHGCAAQEDRGQPSAAVTCFEEKTYFFFFMTWKRRIGVYPYSNRPNARGQNRSHKCARLL